MRYKLQDKEKHQSDSTILWLTIWTFSIFIYALCYFSLITPSVILGQCFSNFKVYITDLAPCWKAESDLGIQKGPEMLHKMPAVAAGPHTADHSLNNETDDRLLERGKTLSLLLLDPTPTNSSVSICYPTSKEAEIAHTLFYTPFPCPVTITAYWVCPAAHQVLPILPPKFLSHMFPPLPWHCITVSWLVFLFLLIHLLCFCQNDNPEIGFSLPQRKKSNLYHHSIHAIFTLWLPFNLPGWYYTTSHINPGLLPYKTGHGSQKGLCSFTFLLCACLIFSLENSSPSPSLYIRHFLQYPAQMLSALRGFSEFHYAFSTVVYSLLYAYTKLFVFSGVHILQCFIRFLYLAV